MVVVVGYHVCCFIQRATIAAETVGYAWLFPPKCLHGSVWCWYITVGIALKQLYIILYIWLYNMRYILFKIGLDSGYFPDKCFYLLGPETGKQAEHIILESYDF